MSLNVFEYNRFGKGIDESSEVPFYYDKQLLNELTSVSLHANKSTPDNGVTWEKWNGPTESDPNVGEYRYGLDPLIRSILAEDYQVAVSNTFSEFGADLMGNMFNQFKPYAPYAGHLAKALLDANRVEEEMKVGSEEEKKSINSSVGKALDKFTDIVYKGVKEMPSLLNRTLIAQGARFSYYSGTGVGFGNLSMKFTVFSDWIDGEFKSVDDQLNKIYPYCFGKYVDAIDGKGNVTGTGIDASSLDKDFVNDYFGWQLPPGGYEAYVKDIDLILPGTLKLKFGAFYSLPNLVIENAQFNFSKQMVKYWENGENNITPLSCDVVLTFKPATKFTDVAMKNLINGSSMEKEREAIETVLSRRITDEMEKNYNFLNGK